MRKRQIRAFSGVFLYSSFGMRCRPTHRFSPHNFSRFLSFSGLTGITAEAATTQISKLDGADIATCQKLLDIKNRGTTKADKVSVLVDFLKKPSVQHSSTTVTKKRKSSSSSTSTKKRAKSDDVDDDTANEIAALKAKLAKLEGKPAPKKTASKKAPAKRKTKAKKPERTGPKRALSAYFFYLAEIRTKTKEANPEMSIGELGKLMGKMWNKLTDEEKKPYEATLTIEDTPLT